MDFAQKHRRIAGAFLLSADDSLGSLGFALERPMNDLQPTLDYERELWQAGYRHVAGLDEAGRGALAGPVVAAAVIIAPDQCDHEIWSLVRDSKLLTPAMRQRLAVQIRACALAWSVGMVAAAEIDRIGIAPATRQAMCQAVAALATSPDHLLIDWVRLPMLALPQICVAKADQHMASVAAASILAKVTRDALLVALDDSYPAYGFAQHKGYGSRHHLEVLRQQGPCPEHRHSFAPIAPKPTRFVPNHEARP